MGNQEEEIEIFLPGGWFKKVKKSQLKKELALADQLEDLMKLTNRRIRNALGKFI